MESDDCFASDLSNDHSVSDPLFVQQYLINNPVESIPIVKEVDNADLNNDQLESVENHGCISLSADETTLISHMPSSGEIDNEILILALDEGKHPMSVVNDKYCEELAPSSSNWFIWVQTYLVCL